MRLTSIALILFTAWGCNSESEKTQLLEGNWEASSVIAEGNSVPDYLASDLEINFSTDGKYTGNLEFLELPNEGNYTLLEGKLLLLSTDTLQVKKLSKDTLFLHYESYGVKFQALLVPNP